MSLARGFTASREWRVGLWGRVPTLSGDTSVFAFKKGMRMVANYMVLLAGLVAMAGYGADVVQAKAGNLAIETRAVRIVAAGDVMLGSHWPNAGELPPGNGAKALSAVADIFRGADVTIANLEGVMSDGSTIRPMKGTGHEFRFLMPTAYAQHLAKAGIMVANLANNHSNDAGPEGRSSTIRALDGAGVLPVGVPERPDAVVTTRAGLKVGLVGFAPHMGTLGFDREAMRKRVRELKGKCDLVVVTMHAGAEGDTARRVPVGKEMFLGADRGDVRAFAHAAVDAGADLVVGHGPHVLRGLEIHRGRLIAYSLGNFCTYGRFNLKGRSGFAAALEVDLDRQGRFVGGRVRSTVQDKGAATWAEGVGPVPDATGKAIRELRDLSRADFGVSVPEIRPDGSLALPETATAMAAGPDPIRPGRGITIPAR
jgi:poly-gamma-glutamate capsule biosynthesis protein CapA/YwtB (metallophosphatase superfamily)